MTFPAVAPSLGAVDLPSAVEALRAHGLRISAARRLVLEALFAAKSPVSAEQIARGLGGRLPPSDLASVYRNLELMSDLGLVRHVHLGHGPGLYAPAATDEREYLLCERCHASRSIDPRALDGAREAIRRACGFEASFMHFPVVGLCSGCADAAPR